MDTFAATLFRDTTCALAAALITVLLGITFVESTAGVPGAPTVAAHAPSASVHRWFGQPEPAVLVD